MSISGGGRNLRILRDLRLSTKVLILHGMLREPGIGQRELAAWLEVTPQAVSEYLKHMEEEGLVEREGRAVRPTMSGFQFLQEQLQGLGEFTYQAMRELNVIRSCAAVAGEDLREGDGVVLDLEEGVIVARRGEGGASTGIAARDARTGEDLAVRDLEGLLSIPTGSVTVVSLPTALDGGTSGVDLAGLGERLDPGETSVVAVTDPVGLVAARRLGLDATIRFAVESAVVDAALRGEDVLVLGGRDSVAMVLEAVEEHNKRSGTRLELRVVDAAGR